MPGLLRSLRLASILGGLRAKRNCHRRDPPDRGPSAWDAGRSAYNGLADRRHLYYLFMITML
jgi:hypothetical protein